MRLAMRGDLLAYAAMLIVLGVIPSEIIAKASRSCPDGFVPLHFEGTLWFYQPGPREDIGWIDPSWRVQIGAADADLPAQA